jgi:hypothetical protein
LCVRSLWTHKRLQGEFTSRGCNVKFCEHCKESFQNHEYHASEGCIVHKIQKPQDKVAMLQKFININMQKSELDRGWIAKSFSMYNVTTKE